MSGAAVVRAAACVVLAASACRPRAERAAPDGCAHTDAVLPADARAHALVGAFRLTLVAASGPRQGQRVEGSLSLIAADTLHYGSADVDLEAVGALRLGDLAATDPAAPGVRVLASPGDILLRLGSEANRAGVLRFDGGYAVLRVREMDDRSFRGTWASGVTADLAAGYFCATKAAGP